MNSIIAQPTQRRAGDLGKGSDTVSMLASAATCVEVSALRLLPLREVCEIPVPGMPTVVVRPELPIVVLNPFSPAETLILLLPTLSRTPGIRRTDLRKRNPMTSPLIAPEQLNPVHDKSKSVVELWGTRSIATIACILFIPPDHPLLPTDLHQAPEADRVDLFAGRVE